MGKANVLKALEEELEAVSKYSEEMDMLISIAKELGHPTLDVIARISSANQGCQGHMIRYLDCFSLYYGVKDANNN